MIFDAPFWVASIVFFRTCLLERLLLPGVARSLIHPASRNDHAPGHTPDASRGKEGLRRKSGDRISKSAHCVRLLP